MESDVGLGVGSISSLNSSQQLIQKVTTMSSALTLKSPSVAQHQLQQHQQQQQLCDLGFDMYKSKELPLVNCAPPTTSYQQCSSPLTTLTKSTSALEFDPMYSSISRENTICNGWSESTLIPFEFQCGLHQQQQQQQQPQLDRFQARHSFSAMKSSQQQQTALNPEDGLLQLSSPSIEVGDSEDTYENDVASALSSLLDDVDRFGDKQSTPPGSYLAPPPSLPQTNEQSLPAKINVSIKPLSLAWDNSCGVSPTMNDALTALVPEVAQKGEYASISPANANHLRSAEVTRPLVENGNTSSSMWRDSAPYFVQQTQCSPASRLSGSQYPLMGPGFAASIQDQHFSSGSPDGMLTHQQQFPAFDRPYSPHTATTNPYDPQYLSRQMEMPPMSSGMEHWRRYLLLKRGSPASGMSSTLNGTVPAGAISTPPASSMINHTRASGMELRTQSPACKRPRTATLLEYGGYTNTSSASGYRLVPPPPIPLQNGVDGMAMSSFGLLGGPPTNTTSGVPMTRWQTYPTTRPYSSVPFPPTLSVNTMGQGFTPPFTRPPPRQIGAYSPQQRRERIQRFLEKRKQRVFHKRVKYDCRKRLANACPRIKGRFVRKDEYLAAVESGQRVTHPHTSDDD